MKMQTQKIAGALLVVGLALGVNAPQAHAQFSKMTEQQEIAAGRQSIAQAYKDYGPPLSQNDARQRRVTRIGALLAAQSTRRSIPFSYTVLQNDKILNAFAAPGGPIFVTTKLMSTTANDAELAYVLGHETGHIEHKDIVNAVAKQQKVGLLAGILGTVLSRGKSGSTVGAVTNVTYGLWQKGFSRKEESNADTYGVRAMARLGFDPRAAVSMLGKLGDGPEGVAKYLSDHPTSPARQNAVTKQIQAENLLQIAQQAGGAKLSLAGNEGDGAIYRPALSNSGNIPANGAVYPSSSSSAGGSSTGNYNANATARATLRAPLRIVNSGNARVVMAPVEELSNYAGGEFENQDRNRATVSRGDASLSFEVGTDLATLNGRQVRLSAPPRVVDGRLYAPLGSVAAGLGGSASYDASQNAVRLEFDGRASMLPLP